MPRGGMRAPGPRPQPADQRRRGGQIAGLRIR
eukprot:COSAG01_NODE_45208_length_411_cov_1.314103_1_plen_31_part_10